MAGFQEKILRIDLKRNYVSEERLPLKWYSQYLGGLGLGLRYLVEDIQSGCLLDKPLLIMAGPLAGTPIPGSAPAVVLVASENGLHCDLVYGHVAAAIKLSGYDGLVLTGEAAFPVWVAVSGRQVDIKEIPGLELTTALEMETKIREIKPEALTVLAVGDNDASNKEFLQRDLAEQMRLKRVKALSIVGDSYFEIEGSMKDFLPGVSAYAASCLKEHQGEATVQMAMLKRKSCFGCPQGCSDFYRDGQGAGFMLMPPLNGTITHLVSEQNKEAWKYCLPSCPKWPSPPTEMLRWLKEVTGFSLSLDELELIGQRVFTLYQVLERYYRTKETLPAGPEYLQLKPGRS